MIIHGVNAARTGRVARRPSQRDSGGKAPHPHKESPTRESDMLGHVEAEARHICEYEICGVCEDCPRVKKPIRGSPRWLRIEKIRAGLRRELNRAGEEIDDG